MVTNGTETSPEDEMKIDPARASELATNLATTLQKIKSANPSNRPIRLVAVSKLKPASDILSLASSPATLSSTPHLPHLPHLHFGENYTQELHHKSALLPRSINWHFIGSLQSNKCRALAEQIPNLWAVESVDTTKKADGLEKGRRALGERIKEERDGVEEGKVEAGSNGDAEEGGWGKLRVYVQVNTSGEDSKSGCDPGSETLALIRHIGSSCPHLHLQGLMTIGAIARSEASQEGAENEDFIALIKERDSVCAEMGWERDRLELSMGMSADFEAAIRQGSDEVRVGTGIFGARPPKKGADEKGEGQRRSEAKAEEKG